PPGDRHVERVVAASARRLVVPHGDGFEQRLVRRWQAKIGHHRCSTGQRRAGAAFKIIGRVSAHKGHFEMGVRVDAAGHYKAARRIELMIALQVITNRDDRAIPDQYVGLIGTIRRYDGAVPDNFGHASVPLCFRAASAEQLQNPNLKDSDHSTISAVSTTAWNSTSAPAAAHSFEISSASLCDRPSTHG